MAGDASRRFPGLSLVLPAYNEADGILRAIAEADDALARLVADGRIVEGEILVVDDGSSDATAAIVTEQLPLVSRLRLLRHDGNRGYGAALRTGFEAARFDRVAFTDADCQFYLEDLAPLLAAAETFPIVVGRRIDRQDPLLRKIYSWGYNTLVRALLGTGVRDCDCALKVFHHDALSRILPETRGFFVNAEMLTRARQNGMPITEVGVRHRPRLRGHSKVSVGDVPRTLRVLLPFWWSRVLFAGAAEARTPSTANASLALMLLLLLSVLFVCRINCPLLEPEEARYAEIPRQMLVEDRWLVPTLHGQSYLDKPPLLYWLVMGSYTVLGVHDWAARLVAVIAAWLTVVIVYLWGRATVSQRAGLAAAFMLALCPDFLYRGRMLTMNGLLTFWVTAALAAGHWALFRPRLHHGWWMLAGLCCGLGMLTKGPIAAVLVAGPLLLVSWLDPRLARPSGRQGLVFIAVVLSVFTPWFVVVAIREPQFVQEFLWLHHLRRFVASLDHREPIGFYVPQLVFGTLPWSLLTLPLAGLLLSRRGRHVQRRPAALGLFLLATIWTVVIFSLADCKRAVYLLPVFPPLALALGCTIDAIVPRRAAMPMLWQWRSHWATASTVLGLASAVVLGLTAWRFVTVKPERMTLMVVLAAIALVGVLLRQRVSWATAAGCVFTVALAFTHDLLPAYHRKFSLRNPVREQANQPEAASASVICYPRRWDSVSFYLQRQDVRVYSPETRTELLRAIQRRPRALVFVKTGYLDRLIRDLPKDTEFVTTKQRDWVTIGEVRMKGWNAEPAATALAR